MPSLVGDWRRRRRGNPLRRRSDVVEAWTALAVAVLLFVVAPLAGIATGWWAHDGTRARAATQRAERHEVHAILLENAPAAVPSTQGGKQPSYPVQVRWTEPGQGPRTGVARVPAGTLRGDSAGVWLDARGRIVGAPMTEAVVWQHTVTTGVYTTGGAVAVVLVAHGVVRRVAIRHRMAEWEREWARTGPEWRRYTP